MASAQEAVLGCADLLVLILRNLPPATVARCRLLNTRWCAIISTERALAIWERPTYAAFVRDWPKTLKVTAYMERKWLCHRWSISLTLKFMRLLHIHPRQRTLEHLRNEGIISSKDVIPLDFPTHILRLRDMSAIADGIVTTRQFVGMPKNTFHTFFLGGDTEGDYEEIRECLFTPEQVHAMSHPRRLYEMYQAPDYLELLREKLFTLKELDDAEDVDAFLASKRAELENRKCRRINQE